MDVSIFKTHIQCPVPYTISLSKQNLLKVMLYFILGNDFGKSCKHLKLICPVSYSIYSREEKKNFVIKSAFLVF